MCVILHFSKKLTLLPNTLNSGVPVAPISTSKSFSHVNFPIISTVSLNTVALFNVIPLDVLNLCIYLIVSGQHFYYFVMKNFCSVDDIIFNELFAFAC